MTPLSLAPLNLLYILNLLSSSCGYLPPYSDGSHRDIQACIGTRLSLGRLSGPQLGAWTSISLVALQFNPFSILPYYAL